MYLFFIILGSIILFLFIILLVITLVTYKIMFGHRVNKNPNVKYFTYKDFNDIDIIPFSFKSNLKQEIKGNIYFSKDKNILKKEIIFFFHGFGGGHINYMHEIHEFTQKGYYVLSYDNTATFDSGGTKLKGLNQSLIDANYAYLNFKKLDEFKDFKLILAGHSWGAFTAINSSNFIKEAKKVVALASFSFASFPSKGNLFLMKLLRPYFYIFNKILFKKYASYNSKKTLINSDLNTKYLLIHGKEDKVVYPNQSFLIYQKIKKDNIKLYILNEKGHSPQLDIEAEKYLNVFLKDLDTKEFINHKEIYDYDLLTKQDQEIYKIIFNFLKED